MTRDEIAEFLIENDIDHTRHNIDAIEEIYSIGFLEGQDVGYKKGYQAGFAYGNEVGRREGL